MHKIIHESEMDFIADNSFHIEASDVYKNIGEGVRTVEFIRIKNDVLHFVEAKPSFPNPNNPNKDNETKFQSAIDKICEKFIHSLNLFLSVEIGIAEEHYPDDFFRPTKPSLVFLLVIKNHMDEWCRPVKQKLDAELPHYIKKIWNPRVYVINERIASEQGFIVSTKDR